MTRAGQASAFSAYSGLSDRSLAPPILCRSERWLGVAPSQLDVRRHTLGLPGYTAVCRVGALLEALTRVCVLRLARAARCTRPGRPLRAAGTDRCPSPRAAAAPDQARRPAVATMTVRATGNTAGSNRRRARRHGQLQRRRAPGAGSVRRTGDKCRLATPAAPTTRGRATTNCAGPPSGRDRRKSQPKVETSPGRELDQTQPGRGAVATRLALTMLWPHWAVECNMQLQRFRERHCLAVLEASPVVGRQPCRRRWSVGWLHTHSLVARGQCPGGDGRPTAATGTLPHPPSHVPRQ